MKNLVEHIIDGEFVEANNLFLEELDLIRDRKLFEMKRSIELTEVVKPTGKKDVDGNPTFTGQNTKADWAKYRKQNKLPKSPKHAPESAPMGSGKRMNATDIKKRRAAGYVQAHPALKGLEFIQKVAKYKETGKLDEDNLPNTPIGSAYSAAQKRVHKADMGVLHKDVEKAKEKEATEKSKPSKVDLWYAKQKKTKGGKSGQYDVKSSGERLRSHLSNAWNTIKTGTRTDAKSGETKQVSRMGALKRAGRLIGTVPGVQKARNVAGAVMNSPWEVTHSESVVNEVLNAKTPVKSVIRDFIHSKNKTFKGDSKKKRIKRALGAYYSMHEAKAWKDLSQEAKKHPFGKSKNNVLTKRKRKRRLVKKIFNEE